MNAPATHLPGGHTSRGARTTAAAGSSCQPPSASRRPNKGRGWLAFPARQAPSDARIWIAGGGRTFTPASERANPNELSRALDLPPGQTAVDTHPAAAGGGRQEHAP